MIYTVLHLTDEFDFNIIPIRDTCRVINKKRTISLICSGFDIETTNIIKRNSDNTINDVTAIMYHWQMSIDNYVILGRTWKQLEKFFKWLDTRLTSNIIIWVANLGFEFSFLMSHFEIKNCFCKEPYKPLKFKILNKLEFRDCLQVTGGNLEYLAKNYCSPDNQKLKGDLDFKKIRNTKTLLSEREEQYCINDVTILSEFAQYIFDNFFDVPLTKTGILRQECKTEFDKLSDKSQKYIKNLMPPENEYKLVMHYLFSGGYTHGNLLLINRVLENCAGFDIVSSYPAVMLQEYYPMTKFYKHKFTVEDNKITDDALNNYCCYFTAVFTNVEMKLSHCILSEHKMIYTEGAEYENGKLVKAKIIKLMMTELDYFNFCKFYTWKKCAVRNGHIAKRGRLPDYLLKLVIKYYQLKNEFKKQGKKDTLDYMLSKQKLNSFYGLTVTKIVREEMTFDSVTLEFCKIPDNKPWFTVVKKSFLSPYWGIWVTAHARYRLLTMIYNITCNSDCLPNGKQISDVVYSDTDSLYIRNYLKHKKIIEDYNNEIQKKNTNLPEGFETLGTFELDGIYDRFKCLGAKRYMTEKHGIYHATIAGVNGDKYLDTMPMNTNPFDYFDLYKTNILDLDVSGKHAHYYFPKKRETLTDKYIIVDDGVNAVKEPCFSGCAIFDVSFKLSFMEKWVAMIKTMFDNLYGDDEDEIY